MDPKPQFGCKTIGTGYGEGITLHLTEFQGKDCSIAAGWYGGPYDGHLLIGEAKENKNDPGPAKAWFWFEADGVSYLLKMYGEFGLNDPWPLVAIGQTNTLTLIGWVMTTEGKGSKSIACTGSGGFSTSTQIVVERK
ncbi:MAG: hypothetical protein ACE5I0_06890 [Candidatus Binatia bacterium]